MAPDISYAVSSPMHSVDRPSSTLPGAAPGESSIILCPRLAKTQASLPVQRSSTTALHTFAFAHVTQAALDAEAVAAEQSKRIPVLSGNQDTWLTRERERQGMDEQP